MAKHLFPVLLIVTLFVTGVPHASAQQEGDQKSLEQLWTDAIYYIKIGRMDLGQANLQAFLDRNPEPLDVLKLAEQDPSGEQVLIKLQSNKELGDLAARVLELRGQGWQDTRRDTDRIAAEIERLGGSPRAQFHALTRLQESGEFAVPVMVEYFANSEKVSLHGKIIDALVQMGPSVIQGLVVAVQHADNQAKLLIIETLARLDYPQVLPYLKQLAQDQGMPENVRNAAAGAIEQISLRNPRYRSDASAAALFYQLAQRYYYRDSAVVAGVPQTGLVPDVRADQPNIWLWRDGKLVDQPVPWEIYYELMAMRMSRRALQLDGSLNDALTLWLMANCKRELRLSEQVTDPLHGPEFPDCGYFLRTAGTFYCLSGLDRTLADNDVAVALKMLEALTDVAAGNDILRMMGDRQPIVAALNSPNQLVRLWSALALGWSAPGEVYPTVDRVVPLLGKVLVGPEMPLAVVTAAEKTQVDQVTPTLEKLGYEVAAFESVDAWQNALADLKPRVEAVLIDYGLPIPGVSQVVGRMEQDPLLRSVPTVVMTAADTLEEARSTLQEAPQVAVVAGVPDEAMLEGRLVYLRQQLGREIASPEQARAMAILAAKGLGRLAAMELKNYQVARAGEALSQCAAGDDWELAYECGKVLAMLSQPELQQGLASAALGRGENEQKIQMLALLRTSVRKHGSRLTAEQISQLQGIVFKETAENLRNAAAAVVGALNLPPEEARKVILEKEAFGQVGP